MKKLLGSIALLALAMPVAAQAADLPVAAPAYKAPVAAPLPAYNWTGFYFGGSLGGEFERIQGNFVNPPPASWEIDNSRGMWDAHVGAQFQFGGGFVLGVEGDFVGLFNNDGGTDSCHPVTSCGAGNFLRARIHDNIWTVGGKGGWSFGAWMPYISGGFASTKVDNTLFAGPGVAFESTQTTHNGAYIGGGLDWQVWTTPGGALVAGFEYRHYEFQSVTATPILFNGLPNNFDTWTIKPRADTIEAKLSWLFNWGGPVVARY